MENGDFWSVNMYSFNHYAYGSVIDWMYEKAAGIRHDSEHPGFSQAIIAPIPAVRIGLMYTHLSKERETAARQKAVQHMNQLFDSRFNVSPPFLY